MPNNQNQPPSRFNPWIDPNLTIPIDDNSFIIDTPLYEMQHIGTPDVRAFRQLPMFPFPVTGNLPCDND